MYFHSANARNCPRHFTYITHSRLNRLIQWLSNLFRIKTLVTIFHPSQFFTNFWSQYPHNLWYNFSDSPQNMYCFLYTFAKISLCENASLGKFAPPSLAPKSSPLQYTWSVKFPISQTELKQSFPKWSTLIRLVSI